ncbi:MAG: hypothetical protein OMM_09208 [Candidatus Magnetoglobus multicellularis str. Araruama]|uniref:Phage-Barnase-EndoU-ColicinE5/D-RelE like nuclease 3 domain-containing protein n=1 Tax=Candidatus Magnetoglobus multicellularis str. Araruama TaxID=890399 RepID=A0A1V1P561_9BACT|nr:MAG: hypothetical protein OMM_09208 [Candidatus Magnetoglobus multicellularis str. Araruama]
MEDTSTIKQQWIFQVQDYNSTTVKLSKLTWQTKAGNGNIGSHPEIKEYLDAIINTIQIPDIVFESSKDTRSKLFYKLNAGKELFENKHLVVVVKYVMENELIGYVSTLYLSRSVYTRGTILWMNNETSIKI